MNDESQIWYGFCTYWTDDWDFLKPTPENKGIPSCPECGSVGFQMTIQDWNQGIAKYEVPDNPGYAVFVTELKEKCHGKTTMLELWEQKKGVLAKEVSPEEEE